MRIVDAVLRADHLKHQRAIEVAWLSANLITTGFHDPKKMPSLDEVTGRQPVKRVQSPQEMKAIARVITAAMHGEVT